nr:unnamed protein product [Digitaria exilis]
MSYSRGSRSVESSDAENPGNNLYVTGLSARVTDQDLEKHFSTEGEVIDASVVHDPWTRESRDFADSNRVDVGSCSATNSYNLTPNHATSIKGLA